VDKVDSFSKKFIKIVSGELAENNFVPIVEIDAEIPLDLLTYGILQELETYIPLIQQGKGKEILQVL